MIIQVQNPTPIKFLSTDGVDQNIVQAAAGFNHCIALTDKGNLYVWGKCQGIYPNVELTREYLESKKDNILNYEMN